MSNLHRGARRSRLRRGFTLVELLFAIIILLFGVVVALRIFPPGFEVFNENQRLSAAQAQTDGWLSQLEADPDGMPDAILPVDFDALYANITAINLSNLTSVAYTDDSAIAWAFAHRYPSDVDPWPSWQPLSARLFRRVLGEKFTIPSDIRASSSAVNLAILPKYTPRFAPLQAGQALAVYDQRYAAKSETEVKDAANSVTNIYYVKQPVSTGSVTFVVPFQPDRDVRVTFLCKKDDRIVPLTPAIWELTDASPSGVAQTGVTPTQQQRVSIGGQEVTADITPYYAGTSFYEVTFNFPGWTYLAGSEQLNHAYHLRSDILDPMVADPTQSQQSFLDLSNLAPGEFYIMPEAGHDLDVNMLRGLLVFSRQDTGKRVKIDYTVADWGILHDDVSADSDGYLNLSVKKLKIGYRPNYPREPHPWGLFEPMNSSGTCVVMSLLNTVDGAIYNVEFNPARPRAQHPFNQQGYYLYKVGSPENPGYRTAVDLREADRGRVRLIRYKWNTVSGAWELLPTNSAADVANAVEGQSFRVYYRAQRDWLLQVFKAPSSFGYIQPGVLPNPLRAYGLGWMHVSSSGTNVYVSGIYAGQAVSVDYLHYDLCRITEALNSTTIRVDNAKRLAVGMVVGLQKPGQASAGETAEVTALNMRTSQVTLSGSYTSLPRGTFLSEDGPVDGKLWSVNGEVHTVPPPDPVTGVSTVVLKHLPAPTTTPVVRGVSLTARALWTQPRRGTAYIIDTSEDANIDKHYPMTTRPLGERWRERSVTVVLPSGGG